MSTSDIFDPLTKVHPGILIAKYNDWILFTLLLFFFWAVVGIALRKRFQESRHLRVLVTTVALILTIGTYYGIYRGWLHLGLESLGFLGAILVLTVVFFILFGLMRGYGIKLSTALPLGFALFYLSLWAVSPTIYDTISEMLPLANLILLILFIASVVKIVSAFFHHTRSPLSTAEDLERTRFNSHEPEIEKEIADNIQERRLLKKKTAKLTDNEITTIENIQEYLQRMISIIRERGVNLSPEALSELTSSLRQIARKEDLLRKGTALIRKHINAYNAIHRKNIPELEKRLSGEKDGKKRKALEEEIIYQKRMLQAIDYIQRYESRIVNFVQSFDRLLAESMQKLKGHSPREALSCLEYASKSLQDMKHIYEKEKDLEKYLLKLNKKTIYDLKKEKDRK